LKRSSIHPLLAVLACLFIAMPSNAYAYLDPGTGSFIMQGLVAGIAGGLIAIRAYWRRVRQVFRRSAKDPHGSSGTSETR
jgi:hypothetical protein